MRIESRVDSKAHLELRWGDTIRGDEDASRMSAKDLSDWMQRTWHVSVPSRVTQAWLSQTWATDGVLRVCDDVDQQLGERLRLQEYKERFATEAYDESSRPRSVSK